MGLFPFVDVKGGHLRIRVGEEWTVDLDAHDPDFQAKLEKQAYEQQIFNVLCSSSLDFPEEYGAPEDTRDKFEAAMEAACQRLVDEGIIVMEDD